MAKLFMVDICIKGKNSEKKADESLWEKLELDYTAAPLRF